MTGLLGSHVWSLPTTWRRPNELMPGYRPKTDLVKAHRRAAPRHNDVLARRSDLRVSRNVHGV